MKKYIICLVGPSASGKTTIVNELKRKYNKLDTLMSFTTRLPRKEEIDGIDYDFISAAVFNEIEKVEQTSYGGNFYGISVEELNKKLSKNDVIVVPVDIYGSISLKQYLYNNSNKYNFDVHVSSIFINTDARFLIDRMIKRGDSIENITTRINVIKETNEYENKNFCDFVFTPSIMGCMKKNEMIREFLNHDYIRFVLEAANLKEKAA